jgi:hypothetical protein
MKQMKQNKIDKNLMKIFFVVNKFELSNKITKKRK